MITLFKMSRNYGGYSLLSQTLYRKKSKRRTSPHPFTLEFTDMILKQMFKDIMAVVYTSDIRSMWLLRFPILYGSIKTKFRCHRSELEQYIEYAREYAIRTYCDSVSFSFSKTPLFRLRVNHFSQVKMRNIIYAMSNTHMDCLGVCKVMCGHTIIWRNTMYNTTRGFYDKDIDKIDKTNIMVNLEMESVHPPSIM